MATVPADAVMCASCWNHMQVKSHANGSVDAVQLLPASETCESPLLELVNAVIL